ncbi:MAG: DNA N-6-adenine-methyltransferase [Dehalococcoidia bacterium]
MTSYAHSTKGMFFSASADWSTPEETYSGLDQEFHFTMDPCPLHADFDGLAVPWVGSVFVNPPYGRGNVIQPWIQKGWEAAQAGALVVMLVPSRTDTIWWHEYVMKGEIRFIQRRLRFFGAKFNAPFPSAVVIFRPDGAKD